MIVNFSVPFIFFKTRKSASTSAEAALEQSFWGRTPSHGKKASVYRDGFVTGRPTNFKNARNAGLSFIRMSANYRRYGLSPSQARRLMVLGPHSSVSEVVRSLPRRLWEESKKIVVVRNPWDKAVSDFFWMKRSRGAQKSDTHSFLAFVSQSLPIPLETEIVDWWDADWRYVRFENFEEDLGNLVAELGGSSEYSIPRFKANVRPSGKSYLSFYTPESRDIVANNWQAWIERFNYRFSSRDD